MMKSFIIGFLISLVASQHNHKTPQLQEIFQWKDLEYKFPSPESKAQALRDGLYIPGNGLPLDVDIDYHDRDNCRTFTTIPRFNTGIPATLATVSDEKGEKGPVLVPYPDYSWHSAHGTNCDNITSVFRIFIDECSRLWVADTGRIGTVQFCPPQLLVFDLRTDTLIRRYRFPQSQYKTGVSLFVTPVVDVRDPLPAGRCSNTKVYIADVSGFGLVVYDFAKDASWRIENKLMYPSIEYGTFTLAGETFDLMDGIIGLAITPRHFKGERYLYFHSLAGSTENAVPLRILDNQETWDDNIEALPRSFMQLGSRGIQSAAEAIDSRGNIFFGLVNPISIAAWNIQTPYRPANIMVVARNRETLQFASGVKVIKNSRGQEELWVLTNRFQKTMTGTRSDEEINFRIQGCLVDDLLNDRPCSPLKSNSSNKPQGVPPRVGGGGGGYNNHKHNDNLIFAFV